MTREEELVRRLCRYLGAKIDVKSTINIGFKYIRHGYCNTWKTDIKPESVWMWNTYLAWSDVLDNSSLWHYGFMDYVRWLNSDGVRAVTDNPVFEYSSLDELEIKLAASGF